MYDMCIYVRIYICMYVCIYPSNFAVPALRTRSRTTPEGLHVERERSTTEKASTFDVRHPFLAHFQETPPDF